MDSRALEERAQRLEGGSQLDAEEIRKQLREEVLLDAVTNFRPARATLEKSSRNCRTTRGRILIASMQASRASEQQSHRDSSDSPRMSRTRPRRFEAFDIRRADDALTLGLDDGRGEKSLFGCSRALHRGDEDAAAVVLQFLLGLLERGRAQGAKFVTAFEQQHFLAELLADFLASSCDTP